MDDAWLYCTLWDPRKGNAVENYCPIKCLPLMWKLLTGVIAEEMDDYLEQEKFLPEEQKGFRLGRCGTQNQLLIDRAVLSDYKERHNNLAMAWIDYKKAHDFVPHSWISECMELFEITDNMRNFLEKSMEQRELSLISNGKDLGEVNVNKGMFSETVFSPLLFFLSMVTFVGTFVIDT